MSYYPPPPQSTTESRPPAPPATESPVQASTADAAWAGAFIVGIVIGVIVGALMAGMAAFFWYQTHCRQVPLVGGTYCR